MNSNTDFKPWLRGYGRTSLQSQQPGSRDKGIRSQGQSGPHHTNKTELSEEGPAQGKSAHETVGSFCLLSEDKQTLQIPPMAVILGHTSPRPTPGQGQHPAEAWPLVNRMTLTFTYLYLGLTTYRMGMMSTPLGCIRGHTIPDIVNARQGLYH